MSQSTFSESQSQGNSLEGSHDRRLYSKDRDKEDLAKEDEFASTDREEYKSTLCDTLTPQEVSLLVHAEDELSQAKVIFMDQKKAWLYI